MNIKYIINEYLNEQFINEDRSSKNRSKARRYLRGVGYSDDKVGELEKELIATFSPYIRDSDFKFMLGVARFTHQGKIRTGDEISKVKDLIKHINMSHLEEYDNDFNGEDFETLHGRFETAIEQDYEKDQETLAIRDFGGKSDYEVVKIGSYDEGRPYSEYTSWCVLGSEDTYNSYTSNGFGIFYFLLKDGYEDVPKERGNNAPKDEYGLSMVAVSVDEFGRLNSSTTRWNHECGGSDNMFTTEELSRLVGQNFYSVFKPRYTKEEIIQRIYNEGEKINRGELNFIRFNQKYYILDDKGKVSLKKYFDNVGGIDDDGFARVRKNNKHNFINMKGEILRPDLWFDGVGYFNGGFAMVRIKNKGRNFINTKGEILSPDLWFDDVGGFNDGFAGVQKNNKNNLINTKGEILSPDLWFDDVHDFDDGFAEVRIKNKGRNFINTKGEILSPNLWFNYMGEFNNGFAEVQIINKGRNFINTKGEILSPDLWFDDVGYFKNDLAQVKIKNGGRNFINTKGEILSPDLWFDDVGCFHNGFAVVQIKNKGYNFINTKGEISNPDLWFDYVGDFHNGFAGVRMNNKGYNFTNRKGEILSPDLWFDDVGHFDDGFARVKIKNKGRNFINTKGEILSPDLWFNNVDYFHNGFAVVEIKNKGRNFINTKGELYYEDRKTKLTPEEIEELKQIQSQVSESLQIKQIINETINEYLNESSHTIYTNTQGDTFWGDVGCGVLPIAKSTGKILIALRSQYVNEPGTWGVIGGAVDNTDGNIKEAAKREFKEETSYGGNIQLIPAYIFETSNKTFKYYNFIGIIPEEFKPTSDWETERFEWITYEELFSLKNKHFGLTKLLEDENSLRIIKSHTN